ncbi:MAG TPA: biotin--[acetyl-CoA-carboxylase] ligase [Acidimicrobiales bacterium]|nr:biotin--[acetyl-CoA-carboxylase] ligase [Acidimicrobiales bacterium]
MWDGHWHVQRFDELNSTNSYLQEEARQGAPEGTVVVADHQTSGRGRLGRRWESPPGASLLVSILFRPDLRLEDLHLCTATVALAAVDACRDVAQVEPALKWPNDLLVGERKLAGVLAEADFEGGACTVVVGIGINVAWPGPPDVGGTCLNQESGRENDRDTLLHALLAALAPLRARLDTADGRRSIAADLRSRCTTLGQRVHVELANRSVEGVATDVDEAGHLVVHTDSGLVTVLAGDVVHLRPS